MGRNPRCEPSSSIVKLACESLSSFLKLHTTSSPLRVITVRIICRFLPDFSEDYSRQDIENLPADVSATVTTTPLGLALAVEYAVTFRLFVEGKYPKQAPTLVCTSYELGDIADGRDLVPSVLRRKWCERDTLNDVVQPLADFSVIPTQKELQRKCASGESTKDLGCFHLGYPMHLDLWEKHPQVQRFECSEYDPRGFRSPRDRILVLTTSRLLVLEPSTRFPGIAHLLVAASYNALSSIKWLNFNKELLNFYWKLNSGEIAGQQLHFLDPAAVLDAIYARARASGVEGIRVTAPEIIQDSELSGKSSLKVDIERLKMEIDATESGVVSTPTVEAVNGLLATFQRVIEYYSAVGDSKYDDYLKRMHEVLHNERIQRLLGYVDEVQREDAAPDDTEQSTDASQASEHKDEASTEESKQKVEDPPLPTVTQKEGDEVVEAEPQLPAIEAQPQLAEGKTETEAVEARGSAQTMEETANSEVVPLSTDAQPAVLPAAGSPEPREENPPAADDSSPSDAPEALYSVPDLIPQSAAPMASAAAITTAEAHVDEAKEAEAPVPSPSPTSD